MTLALLTATAFVTSVPHGNQVASQDANYQSIMKCLNSVESAFDKCTARNLTQLSTNSSTGHLSRPGCLNATTALARDCGFLPNLSYTTDASELLKNKCNDAAEGFYDPSQGCQSYGVAGITFMAKTIGAPTNRLGAGELSCHESTIGECMVSALELRTCLESTKPHEDENSLSSNYKRYAATTEDPMSLRDYLKTEFDRDCGELR